MGRECSRRNVEVGEEKWRGGDFNDMINVLIDYETLFSQLTNFYFKIHIFWLKVILFGLRLKYSVENLFFLCEN